MGFGEEFRNMRANGGSPKITDEASKVAATDAEALAKAEPVQAAADPDVAIYQQPFTDQQTLGEAVQEGDEPPVIPPPKPEQAAKKVKLNGKTFDSMEDALDYAAKLEVELEKSEAVKKALEDIKPKPAAPVTEKETKKIAEKFFENPEEALEDLSDLITKKAEQIIENREKQKENAHKAKADAEAAWTSFYKDNSDLVDWQEEVNLVTQRNWESIKDLPAEQGLAEIARQSRAYVASLKERALPKQALSSKQAVTSSAGGKLATATKAQTTEKKLSFIDQIRSTNKRTAIHSES